MRHVDSNIPYSREYIDSFSSGYLNKRATIGKTWVKILHFVLNHDGCTRKEIIKGVWNINSTEKKRYCIYPRCTGYCSSIFSQMLYLDVIDYDKKFKYHITNKGIEALENAHLNELLRIERKVIANGGQL